MDLLEQPFEAVAFRLYSLPEAAAPGGAAAWTCLAAVLAAAAAAAAAGIWRLRAAAPVVAMGVTASGEDGLEPETSSATATSEQARSSERQPEPASWPSPKETYTAYYHDSCCVGCCDMDDEDGEEVLEEDDDEEPSETMPFEWEVVRSLPLSPTAAAAEVGRYRASTPLGGNVVRLWDHAAVGGLTAAAASPRRRGLAGGVVSAF